MEKIAIHSVPRSGSSWLGQIFNSSPNVNFKFQPLFSYAFKGHLNASSSKKDIDDFFKKIEQSKDDFLLQKDKVKSGLYPEFKKDIMTTHVVYKEVRYHNILENMLNVHSDVKVIGLVRNPFAVINSFLSSPREFRKDLGWNVFDEWKNANKKNCNKEEEYFGYEKWKEVLFLFKKLQKKYPDNFYYLNYNDLLGNTLDEVFKLFEFCSLRVTEQTKQFIKTSRNVNKNDVYSVYKNRLHDKAWKMKLPIAIIKEIEDDLRVHNLEEFIIS